VLLGGNSRSYLRMSGSTANLLDCNVLTLRQTSFSLLELIFLDFSDPATVAATLDATPSSSVCFEGEPTDVAALGDLQGLLGVPAATTTLTLTKLEVFHLAI
jgi:hypothetical protein